jgi:aryl-alcohol dehydrogenase-like predicted oxidoreductase
MQYRKLGKSDLQVSEISCGAWELGGGGDLGTEDQSQVDQVVGTALDLGINLFDTAEGYGNGRSERMLGRALRGRRDEALIATKFRDFETWTVSLITERLEESLERLGTDFVDLYQAHWPKREMTARDGEVLCEAFAGLRERGLVRYAGVSNFRIEHLRLLPEEGLDLIVSNQVPYNLLKRQQDNAAVEALCLERSISFLAYSPLATGLLCGKYSSETRPPADWQVNRKLTDEAFYPHTAKVLDTLNRVAGECGRNAADVALQWILQRPVMASVIVGTRKEKHLRANAQAAGKELSAAHLQELDRASGAFEEARNALAQAD